MTLALALLACAPEVAPPIVAPPEPPPAAVDGAVAVVLRVPKPSSHLIEIEQTVVAPGPKLELRMATWTPGSYTVRDYSKGVETLAAVDATGRPLKVVKTEKNRWEVEGQGPITVRYRVFARDLSVRSAFVDEDLGVLAGAALFLRPVIDGDPPWDVRLELPEGWPQAVTGLDPHPDGVAAHWLARGWDELIDSPIVAGRPELRTFEVSGVPHTVATFAADARWDHDRAMEDVRAIAEAQATFWGVIPYDHYVFLNVVAEVGGGLEHADSSLLFTRSSVARTDEAWDRWLGLVSHELFHAWNVKRLRPAALGPFDYEHEVETPSLWVAEGLTAYYDDVLLVRSGRIDGAEHLKRMSSTLASHQGRHGRLVQPLTASSFDAWIKYYREEAGKEESQVSYYDKGALAGWLIDARIQACTGGERSLDDALRLAWDRYSGERGYTEAELRGVIVETAGCDLRSWLAELLDGTDELDLTPALSWWGLRLKAVDPPKPEDPPKVWTGVEGGPNVTRVHRGSPGWEAGVNLGDELVAVDGVRVFGGDVAAVIAGRKPGDTVEFTVTRRGRLRTIPVVLGAPPEVSWTLEIDPSAGRAAAQRRAVWWGTP